METDDQKHVRIKLIVTEKSILPIIIIIIILSDGVTLIVKP